MHLQLTHQEAEWLQHLLLVARQDHPGEIEQVQALLTKLVQTQAEAMRQRQCPICLTWFTQERVGRVGCYCSAACKQKAYRQRQQARKKQFVPSSHR